MKAASKIVWNTPDTLPGITGDENWVGLMVIREPNGSLRVVPGEFNGNWWRIQRSAWIAEGPVLWAEYPDPSKIVW